MDDLSSRLSEILGDPASMEKIKSLAALFSSANQNEGKKEERRPETPPHAAEQQNSGAPGVDPALMRSVMKLAPTLSRMRQEDDSTRLLHALRPFLSEGRRRRLDEALRLMQLARVLPYLRNSGLLQSLL